jgi:hypothetical protein
MTILDDDEDGEETEEEEEDEFQLEKWEQTNFSPYSPEVRAPKFDPRGKP